MIALRSSQEIEALAESGRLAEECMLMLEGLVQEGISTWEIDREAETFIRRRGAIPSCKGYGDPSNPFPATLCTSINDEIVHGIPSKKRVLKAGDILKIDLVLSYHGYVADMARTLPVGSVTEEKKLLAERTRECFQKALEVMVPGKRIGDIGSTVQTYAESFGYGVIRDLCGHGIGTEMHEDPNVPNYGRPGRGVKLEAGMTIAVEPMISMGTWKVYQEDDGWTVVTRDGSLCSHYEHTLLITDGEPEILSYPGARVSEVLR